MVKRSYYKAYKARQAKHARETKQRTTYVPRPVAYSITGGSGGYSVLLGRELMASGFDTRDEAQAWIDARVKES
jgi:hypothetical protein